MDRHSRLQKRLHFWGVMIGAFVVPSSGYVFFGKPVRGLLMLCWTFALGYITFQLTTPEISWMGRLSGGLTVWTLSLLETRTLALRYFTHSSP